MKIKLAVFCLALIFVSVANAQDYEARDRIARFAKIGAIGIDVQINLSDAAAQRAGLSEDYLRNFIELKLRQNGIAVRPVGLLNLESPFLYFSLNILNLDSIKHYAFNASLQLRQNVKLLRTDEVIVGAITWNKAIIVITKSTTFSEQVKNNLNELFDVFLNRYMEANPAKSGKEVNDFDKELRETKELIDLWFK